MRLFKSLHYWIQVSLGMSEMPTVTGNKLPIVDL